MSDCDCNSNSNCDSNYDSNYVQKTVAFAKFAHIDGTSPYPSTDHAILYNTNNNQQMLCQISPHFSEYLYMIYCDILNTNNDNDHNHNDPHVAMIPMIRPERFPESEFDTSFAILASIFETNPDIFYNINANDATPEQLQQVSATIIAKYIITEIISLITLLDYLQISPLLQSITCAITERIRSNIVACDDIFANFNLVKDANGDNILQYEIPYNIILSHIQPLLMVHEVTLIVKKKCIIVRDGDLFTHFYDPEKEVVGYYRTFMTHYDPQKPLNDEDMKYVTHICCPRVNNTIVYPNNVKHILFSSPTEDIAMNTHVTISLPNGLKSVAAYRGSCYPMRVGYRLYDNDMSYSVTDRTMIYFDLRIKLCDTLVYSDKIIAQSGAIDKIEKYWGMIIEKNK